MNRSHFWASLDASFERFVRRLARFYRKTQGNVRITPGQRSWSGNIVEPLEPKLMMTAASPFDFNEFVFHNDTRSNSDSQGRVAVGGNASFTSFGVGQSLTNSGGTRDDLIAAGTLSFSNGQVFNGNVRSGGTATFSSWGHPNGSYIAGNPLNFTALDNQALATSSYYSGQTATNTSTFQYGTLTLTGTKAVSIINVSGSQLASANTIKLSAPSGGLLVLNINGTSDSISNAGISLSGADNAHVLFNFYQATSLSLSGVGVPGTVLAPNASVSFGNGNINGSLIASSLSGSGQVNLALFAGPQGASSSPTVAITGAPSSSPEGTAITLGSSVSESGYTGSFTYAWNVKQGSTTVATVSYSPECSTLLITK